MYAGRDMESGTTDQVFYDPRHAYTQALQKAIPSLQTKGDLLYTVPGMPPDLSKPIEGCSFYPRCPYPRSLRPTVRAGDRRADEGHCVQECHYCDRSKPIEEVLTQDITEAPE